MNNWARPTLYTKPTLVCLLFAGTIFSFFAINFKGTNFGSLTKCISFNGESALGSLVIYY